MQNGYETPFCRVESIIDLLSEVYNDITPENEFTLPRNDLISYFNWLISNWENKMNSLLYEQIQNISSLSNDQRIDQLNTFKSSYVDIEGKNNTMNRYHEYHLNCLRLEEQEDLEHEENLEDIMVSVGEMFDNDVEEYDDPPNGDENWIENTLENTALLAENEEMENQIESDRRIFNEYYDNYIIITRNDNIISDDDILVDDNIPEMNNILENNVSNTDVREVCFRGINILDAVIDSDNPENSYLSDENYRQLMDIFQEIHNMNS